jgi:hypothetical protein
MGTFSFLIVNLKTKICPEIVLGFYGIVVVINNDFLVFHGRVHIDRPFIKTAKVDESKG